MNRATVEKISEPDRKSLQHFLEQLAKYGIFVPAKGELESWLSDLDVNVRKDRWLEEMFDKLGSLDAPETYVQPADGDVWKFVRQIGHWLDGKLAPP
jgi:hypothetical protein